jgi:hypothetical protein
MASQLAIVNMTGPNAIKDFDYALSMGCVGINADYITTYSIGDLVNIYVASRTAKGKFLFTGIITCVTSDTTHHIIAEYLENGGRPAKYYILFNDFIYLEQKDWNTIEVGLYHPNQRNYLSLTVENNIQSLMMAGVDSQRQSDNEPRFGDAVYNRWFLQRPENRTLGYRAMVASYYLLLLRICTHFEKQPNNKFKAFVTHFDNFVPYLLNSDDVIETNFDSYAMPVDSSKSEIIWY